MKTQQKNNVKQALVSNYKSPKEKFNALLALFLNLPEATASQKRYFNAAGFSPRNLESLQYDIQKLCGIKDTDLLTAKKELKNTLAETESTTTNPVVVPEELKAKVNAIVLADANYNTELKPLAKEVSEILDIKPISQKKDDLIAFLEDFKTVCNIVLTETTDAVKQLFVNAPEEVKVDLKLRDEFPFLNTKDCPDKFKILVADKLTAFKAFKEGREEIKKLLELGATEEELYAMAVETVENFQLNLDIYDELNYYKEHGQILGKHPIFAEDMLTEKVNSYSTVELTKRQKNLRTYVSRDTKKLEKMEAGEDKVAFEEKLNEFKSELELVDARLEQIS